MRGNLINPQWINLNEQDIIESMIENGILSWSLLPPLLKSKKKHQDAQ